jgi:hypothetical protein
MVLFLYASSYSSFNLSFASIKNTKKKFDNNPMAAIETIKVASIVCIMVLLPPI